MASPPGADLKGRTLGALFTKLRDGLRLPWAMLYWNSRKSVFVLRGRRGVCPCQDPSDSGRPGETGCEAALLWNDPAAFRHVCPLLKPTAAGWRCSVTANEVRPFWGRFLLLTVGVCVSCWLVGATLLFAVMRHRGMREIEWWHLAWPGAWTEVSKAEARALNRRAAEAFARGDHRLAALCLADAVTRDPRDYEAGLLLAQVTEYQHSLDYGDRRFEQLLRDFPAQRPRTAIVYHDTLLGLARMSELARFCLRMAQEDNAQAGVWMNSFLLAAHAGGLSSDRASVNLASVPASLRWIRQIVEATTSYVRGDALRARQALGPPEAAAGADALLCRLHLFLDYGDAQQAALELGVGGAQLPVFTQLLWRCRIDAAQGDRLGAQADYLQLLRSVRDIDDLHAAIGLLIEQPDAGSYRRLEDLIARRPQLQTAVCRPALWLAALACGDVRAASQLTAARPGKYPAIERIDFSSANVANPASVPALIGTFSLPRPVIASLYQRYSPAGTEP